MTSTDTPRRRRSPDGLGARGARFWRSCTGSFEFSEAEFHLLEEACRTLDDLDLLAAAVAADGAMVRGSAGQPVVHPALTEARGQRLVLHRLLSALQLPDEDGATIPTSTSMRSSTAARARWGAAPLRGVR